MTGDAEEAQNHAGGPGPQSPNGCPIAVVLIVFPRKRAILGTSSANSLRTLWVERERAISPTTICAAEERNVRFVNLTPSEAPRGAEHDHSLPPDQSLISCASQHVVARSSFGGSLATER